MRQSSAIEPNIKQELLLHFGGQGVFPTTTEVLVQWIGVILYSSGSASKGDLYQLLDKGVHDGTGLKVEEVEFDRAIDYGLKTGHFEQEKYIYTLSASRREEFDEISQHGRLLEDRVKKQWFDELFDRGYTFGSYQQDPWIFLLEFALDVFRQYAYFISANGGSWRSQFDPRKAVKAVVPESHPLSEFLYREIPAFFDAPDEHRLRFIGRLASKAIFAFRLTPTKSVTRGIKQSLREQKLLLDTNIVLALVGIASDRSRPIVVRRVAQLARELGFKLVLTQQTVDEYIATLEPVRSILPVAGATPRKSGPYFPMTVTDIYRKSFAGLYTPIEFYSHFADLESRLQEYDVTIDRQLSRDVAHIAESQEIHKILTSDSDKGGFVLSHDLMHLSYIHAHRSLNASYRSARCWFLTFDNDLCSVGAKLNRKLPLAIKPLDWIIMFRPLINRVEDFDVFFGSLFSTELLACLPYDKKLVSQLSSIVHSHSTSNEDANYVIDAAIAVASEKELRDYIAQSNNGTVESPSAWVEGIQNRKGQKWLEDQLATTKKSLTDQLTEKDMALEAEKEKSATLEMLTKLKEEQSATKRHCSQLCFKLLFAGLAALIFTAAFLFSVSKAFIPFDLANLTDLTKLSAVASLAAGFVTYRSFFDKLRKWKDCRTKDRQIEKDMHKIEEKIRKMNSPVNPPVRD